jgi:malate dehydrogenase (oxaloacetate-decarboxylating)
LLSKEILDPLTEKIKQDTHYAAECTCKKTLIGVITNGTAVLGLGNIGPEAGLPVMEGKCILFKTFGDVDALPICLKETSIDKVVRVISNLSCGLAGINLEDIKAPDCFEIEQELSKRLDIPVFHDDQHGTAIVVLAGLLNSLKFCKKKIEDSKVVINGAGAAGIAITELLLRFGCKNIILCDTKGIIYNGRKENMNKYKITYSEKTNPEKVTGGLKEALKDADVFIGVSVANCLEQEWIAEMKKEPIIFALANPIPEISPEKAKTAGAKIIATGRSDMGNQLNNVLAFPGVFRGLIDCQATKVTTLMKVNAAKALAGLIQEKDLAEDNIIPNIFNPLLVETVSKAVMTTAIEEGNARKKVDVDISNTCKSCFQLTQKSTEKEQQDLEIQSSKSEEASKKV